MDFPPFNHHHHTSGGGGGGGGGNRYAPPPPQPPHHHHHHHHQFSDDRNLYQPPNRHHLPLHHPPPPPSYPSRPPPPTPPPPTPPYNPQQSHFTFNPVYRSSIPDESPKPSFFGHEQQQHHHLSPSRFSSHRFSKLENSYHESWTDPVRFPPESSSRSHLIFHDDHPPYRPTDGYDNDFQRGSVYRGEFVPGFRAMEWDIDRDRDRGRDRGRDRDSDKQIQQVDRDDDVDDNYNHSRSLGHSPGLLNRCSLNTDSFSGRGNLDTDPRTVSVSTSRRADDFVKNYDPDYASLLEPKRSWNDHRDEDTRWDHSKNVDFGHGDSVPFLSGREELRNYESGKFNNRVREGGREEFKQVQKKSVLLRIGKPNSTGRNRTHDKHFSKAASFDDSSNSSFRGKNKDKDKDKDSLLHSDQRMEEGGEGRPVELDVSFKSNALVAKAIVTPSSSSLDSDSNFTPPRTRKSRAVNGSDSPLTKFGERSIRSGSSPHGSHCPSSSEKVTAKETMDKVACEVVSLDDNASLPGCSDKNKFVKSGSVESPSDTVSFRLRKKRKTINLISRPSVFQTTEKDEEPVNGERSKNSSSAIDNGSTQHAAFPSLNDVIVSKVDELPQAMVVERDSSDFDTGTRHQLDTESNNLTPLKCSFSPLANGIDKIDPRIVNLDTSVHDMQSVPDAGDVLTEINGSVCNNFVVQDLNQHPCENEVLLSVENDIVAPSTEDLVSVREDDISGLSRLEVIENGESPTDSPSGANDTREHSSSYNVSPEKQGLNITAEGNSSDTDSNKSCLNEIVAVVPDNGIPAESVDVLKEEEDAKLHNDIMSSSTPSSPNSSLSIFQEKNTVSETCHVDVMHKHDGATIILPSNCPEGSTKAMVIIGDYPGACCGNTPDIKKRKSSYMHFSLSSPRINGTPDNAISSFLDVDLTTSPSKVIVFADDRVINSMGERKTNSVIHDTETDYDRCPSLTQSPVTDEGLPKTDVRTNLLQKDDLPALSSILSTSPHDNVALAAKTNNLVPDTLASGVCTKKVPTLSGSSILTNKLSGHVLPSQNFSKNDDKFQKKPASSIGSVSLAPKSSVNNSRSTKETSNSEVIDVSSNTKTAISASPGSNITVQSLNSVRVGVTLANKQLFSSTSVPKVFPGHGRSSSVFKNSRINAPAKPITKPRTWHRTDGPSAKSLSGNKSSPNPVRPLPKRVVTDQNSYIRSGNTLVRKSVPVPSISIGSHRPTSSIYRPNPSGTDEIRKSAASGSRVDKTYSRTGGSSSPIESSKTPPLPESTTLSDSTTVCSGGLPFSPLEYLPPSTSEGTSAYVGAIECLAAPMLSENLKSSEIREDQTGPVSNKETQKTLDEGNRGQKVRYVKRKSNQLVAASNVINQSIQDVDKTQASVSDGYYKRRKNQLIRTSIGNHMMHNIAGQDDADSELQRAHKINSGRSFSKRQAGKVAAKMYKHSRLSSVWTLNGQASQQNGVSLHRQQVWPHLFPWKRAKSWGSFMNMSASMSSDNTISSISRRLLLSRKRKTIYTKSSHGFSLRMSKLLSVGGSSLKWSKSIEKNSKKASEEATLAVAAAEKRKREQNGTAPIIAGTKSRNNPSRDRIFRIGLLRYKMDPSRRTLQRISDEEPSTSVRLEKEPKRPYIPWRLVIGHDEYVRIGNGNQLVRDPKKRTRIFANEKVRWSLHTARLRLAKKKKYCQFFTRFGKCNKDDGKCPYIHDQSKIAVCTKFLNGSCMDSNCKLTHKVIPERMQDCSYFLQGLCCNEHCPYRHVNVNPSASICEGFLKGYCADGNECRKKHTYVCPTFEATGVCPQGPTCKLHHPKNRSKGLKRKQDSLSGQQQQQQQKRKKNAQGRYFGSSPRHADVVDIRSEDKHYSKNNDDAVSFLEGKLADYISLNFSDEEGGETFDLTGEEIPITMNEDHSVDIGGGTADFDALIKPVRIMNKNLKLTAESPVAFGSPNERTTSAFSEESDSVCK